MIHIPPEEMPINPYAGHEQIAIGIVKEVGI